MYLVNNRFFTSYLFKFDKLLRVLGIFMQAEVCSVLPSKHLFFSEMYSQHAALKSTSHNLNTFSVWLKFFIHFIILRIGVCVLFGGSEKFSKISSFA